MDVERALVSKLATTQSMTEVLARSLEPHHFLQRQKGDTSPEPLPGEVYAWMIQHIRLYRSVPSMGLAQARFPRFQFVQATDSIEALLEQMIRQIKRRELITGIRQLSEIADDPERVSDAEIFAFEIAAELARAVPSSVITRFSDSMSRLELNKIRAENGMLPGISLVVPEIDDYTYGAQDHEMAIIQGFLGMGKSTLAVNVCAKAYFEDGKTPLFFSFEMEGDKLAARWDSYAAQVSYKAMKRGQLQPEDYDKWMRVAEKAAESKFEKDILVIADERRPTSDFIYGQIERWRPAFSVVDTIDEVRAPSYVRGFHETHDYVARELKGVARATKRPLIAVAQSGRDAAEQGSTLQNVAGSITIPRKADIVIGVHSTPDQKKANMVEFSLLKNRDDEGEGIKWTKFWNKGTGEIRPWTPEDGIPKKPS